MSQLHFYKDGILRRSFSRWDSVAETHHDALVPLRAYEQVVDKDAFLKSLHSSIIFEDGLTVGEMMENLAPWAETMIGVGVLDFPAFLEEMRKDPVDKVDDVEGIFLTYTASLGAVPDFNPPAEGDFLVGDPKATGRFQLEQRWDMEARLTEDGQKAYDGATSVAIDYTPMSDWKHLPISIVTTGRFIDETASAFNQAYSGIKQPLTDAAHPAIEIKKGHQGQIFSHHLPINAPGPDFFNCLVRGFLWEVGFSYSPAQRDEQMETLKANVAEIDARLSDESEADLDALEKDLNEAAEAQEDHYAVEFRQKTKWLTEIHEACATMGLPHPITD